MEVMTGITIVLLLAGITPLLAVVMKLRIRQTFMKKAVTTTATVTNCEKRIGFKGAVYYFLSLEFMVNDNKMMQGISGGKKKEIGDRIPLMYLPENPYKFSIDFGRNTALAITLTSLFFLLIIWLCIWLNKEIITVNL